jgi:predicted ester cyclase
MAKWFATARRLTRARHRRARLRRQLVEICRGAAGHRGRRETRTAEHSCFADQVMFQGRGVTRDMLKGNLEDIFTTFPDWHSEIIDMVADHDVVVTRNRVSGTHKGVAKRAVNGGMLVGVQPTGKRFEVQHIRWYKLRDGKTVEHRAVRDDIGMMRQLGLLPPAPTFAPK